MAEITLFKAGRLTHWDSEYDLEESEQRALWLETRTVTLGPCQWLISLLPPVLTEQYALNMQMPIDFKTPLKSTSLALCRIIMEKNVWNVLPLLCR